MLILFSKKMPRNVVHDIILLSIHDYMYRYFIQWHSDILVKIVYVAPSLGDNNIWFILIFRCLIMISSFVERRCVYFYIASPGRWSSEWWAAIWKMEPHPECQVVKAHTLSLTLSLFLSPSLSLFLSISL